MSISKKILEISFNRSILDLLNLYFHFDESIDNSENQRFAHVHHILSILKSYLKG